MDIVLRNLIPNAAKISAHSFSDVPDGETKPSGLLQQDMTALIKKVSGYAPFCTAILTPDGTVSWVSSQSVQILQGTSEEMLAGGLADLLSSDPQFNFPAYIKQASTATKAITAKINASKNGTKLGLSLRGLPLARAHEVGHEPQILIIITSADPYLQSRGTRIDLPRITEPLKLARALLDQCALKFDVKTRLQALHDARLIPHLYLEPKVPEFLIGSLLEHIFSRFEDADLIDLSVGRSARNVQFQFQVKPLQAQTNTPLEAARDVAERRVPDENLSAICCILKAFGMRLKINTESSTHWIAEVSMPIGASIAPPGPAEMTPEIVHIRSQANLGDRNSISRKLNRA